jgi:NADH-quinone oxidoreductase subunit J
VDHVVNQTILFICLVVAGLGVLVALPRRGVSPQIVGAMVMAVALGVLFAVLGVRAYQDETIPPPFFYLFALISVGSALRVITHPKPVYSALYFILTILSSSALFLIMQAEFMAFALIIIYAGAILITYLFVIMLATQAPTESELGDLTDYDAYAREPLMAALAGVLLMVLVSFMLARAVPTLSPNTSTMAETTLNDLPKKVIRELNDRGVFRGLEAPEVGALASDPGLNETRLLSLTVDDPARFADSLEFPRVAELFTGEADGAEAERILQSLAGAEAGSTVTLRLPESLQVTNTESVGFDLIAGHPMALELAGVILLMAMVGAVVLARKQIELSEDEKAAQAHTLGSDVVHTGGAA